MSARALPPPRPTDGRRRRRPGQRLPALLALLVAPLLALSLGPSSVAAATPPDAGAPAGAAAAEPAAEPEVHGLKGEYFTMSSQDAWDFAELQGEVLDPNIDFSNLVGTLESITGQAEYVTARWTGQIEAPTTGEYTFYAVGDNGFRLFIDDEPVIDHWVNDWDVEQTSAPVSLVAGEQHDFRLEYFQAFGGANMFLRWSGPGTEKQVVPTTAFTPPAGFEVYPVELSVPADGRHVRMAFDGDVSGVEDLAEHLTVEADTVEMPVTGVSPAGDDPRAVVVELGEPVLAGQAVRVSYDGEGSLAVDGEAVPQLVNRSAVNDSVQRLTTPWGEDLDESAPLPEYPRPQMVRDRWENLNGPWQFETTEEAQEPTPGEELPETITVPFPVESQLSGIERRAQHMTYRRTVTVPEDWRVGDGERLLLHFGAVDYSARVYVNGQQVADHTGGYTAFSADITDALVGDGPQEVVVAVTDTTDGQQPVGKQRNNPGGIFYTPSSGIWQTVWMEPVADAGIDDLVTTPDVDDSSLAVMVESARASGDAQVTAVASGADGAEVGRVTGAPGEELRLPVPDARLWSPDDPYLYDLEVTLTDGDAQDAVDSYFGMRSVGIEQVGGYPKLVLNGEPIFSLATLDQGFWPDGLNTAPSDEALRFDLEETKALGFNAVRKHIKVEPARWFYHADQLGLLVWQDFVSAADRLQTDAARDAFTSQGFEMMDQVHDSPSVIGYIPFNEGWGEWDRAATGRIAEEVGDRDPTRVVNAHSGVNCCASLGDSGAGDVIDHHDYNNTDPAFPDETRAAMDGEHGGFTLRTPGHMWPGAPTAIYSGVQSREALTQRYVENTRRFYLEQARTYLSGSVYTQITDLETELNGLWTYDREVQKVDPAPVRAINEAVIAAGAAAGQEVEAPTGGASWPLDEGSGTTAQDVGDGDHDLTLRGDTAWVPGVSGSALAFDGDGDSAETEGPVLDTTADYTVAAWARLDSLPGNYATVLSQDGAQQENPFYLQYGDGAFAFSTPGGNRARLVTTPETGRWYHLVGVKDAGTGQVQLYVDGRLAATSQAGPATASTGPFTLGRASFGGDRVDFWDGAIDGVHAFDRALGADEVADLYGSEQPGEPEPEGWTVAGLPEDGQMSAPARRPLTMQWQVTDGGAAVALDAGDITATTSSCDVEGPGAQDPHLRVRPLPDGRVRVTWLPDRDDAGSCRSIHVDLGDGVLRTVDVTVAG